MKHHIATTRNNIPVYVDLIRSSAAKGIAQQPFLVRLAAEVLKSKALRGATVEIEHDMRRPIGYESVVRTAPNSVVLYAQLVHETTFTKFVKNSKPEATNLLSILLSKNTDNSYDVTGIWIGRLRPSQPGGSDEDTAGRTFWEDHAYTLENQLIQTNTLTKTCPY